MKFTYETENVCSLAINFNLDGDVVTDISFLGGCNGNLKAISKLVDGWTVDRIEEMLRGNTCDDNPTSCADQLAIAVREAYEMQKKQAQK
ncbi:MAG: TIGR03905 family TSCPD domain-containing protein [Clostridia bacterium]|nr:TIGR03905 family TSCPD domain-containing protein [Clostridia bacterium]